MGVESDSSFKSCKQDVKSMLLQFRYLWDANIKLAESGEKVNIFNRCKLVVNLGQFPCVPVIFSWLKWAHPWKLVVSDQNYINTGNSQFVHYVRCVHKNFDAEQSHMLKLPWCACARWREIPCYFEPQWQEEKQLGTPELPIIPEFCLFWTSLMALDLSLLMKSLGLWSQ